MTAAELNRIKAQAARAGRELRNRMFWWHLAEEVIQMAKPAWSADR